jgi:hypothetical protein
MQQKRDHDHRNIARSHSEGYEFFDDNARKNHSLLRPSQVRPSCATRRRQRTNGTTATNIRVAQSWDETDRGSKSSISFLDPRVLVHRLVRDQREEKYDHDTSAASALSFIDNFTFPSRLPSSNRLPSRVDGTNIKHHTCLATDCGNSPTTKALLARTRRLLPADETPAKIHATQKQHCSVTGIDALPNQQEKVDLHQLPEMISLDMQQNQNESPISEDEWEKAHEERRWVRQWAQQVRQTCQHWVQQQHELIQQRFDQLNNEKNALRAKLTHEQRDSRANREMARYQETIQQLQQSSQALRREVEQAWHLHHEKEKELHDIIDSQQEQLERLVQIRQLQQHQLNKNTNHVEDASSPSTATTAQSFLPTPHPRPPIVVSPEQLQTLTPSTKRHVQRSDDGTKITSYSNGSVKTVYPNGEITIQYANGDQLRYLHYQDGTRGVGKSVRHETRSKATQSSRRANMAQEYYFAAKQVRQTILPNHKYTIWAFASGQIERHYSNGKKLIQFPDGKQRCIPSTCMIETLDPSTEV